MTWKKVLKISLPGVTWKSNRSFCFTWATAGFNCLATGIDGLYLIFRKRIFWIYLHNGIIVPDICVQLWLAISNVFIRWLILFLYLNFLVVFAQMFSIDFMYVKTILQLSCIAHHLNFHVQHMKTLSNLQQFIEKFCILFFLLVIIHCLIDDQSDQSVSIFMFWIGHVTQNTN